MRYIVVFMLAAVLGGCHRPAVAAGASDNPETRPTEATGQKPAFSGQTRARGIHSATAYAITPVARGLDHPWSLQFLPDGSMLVTERPGRMRIVSASGELGAPIAGVPGVYAHGQGGLFDVALDPGFAQNHTLYFSYFEPRGGNPGLTVASAQLANNALSNVKTIFAAQPGYSDDKNIGGRIVVAPDGTLFITVGDRFELKDDAQKLDNDLGKVVRIDKDGSIPRDNPFVGKAGARPEIWSYGHRNAEGAAINPQSGKLWTVEHGPRGGDEINAPQPGKNYGWPVITYGIDYNGMPVEGGITQHAGMEQPLYYWDPVIAPSGFLFYTGSLFPEWKNNLFVGGLRGQRVSRLTLDGTKITGEEWLFTGLHKRIRDVRQGPDGGIYLLTDETAGQILKVTPKPSGR
ncbi:MAG TPA: PQQ-dependent sugar dehydrogenase [Caulobacteraceae bacterium]|jgi:glucose/arabinose dehydrogenase|nr:PQQ-dependent sugar dehydrogenase [Caulobacteraceae bacterium]